MIIRAIAIAIFYRRYIFNPKREYYVSSLNKQKPHPQKEDEVNANIILGLTL
jgi:hypothetical protein